MLVPSGPGHFVIVRWAGGAVCSHEHGGTRAEGLHHTLAVFGLLCETGTSLGTGSPTLEGCAVAAEFAAGSRSRQRKGVNVLQLSAEFCRELVIAWSGNVWVVA